MIRTKREDGGRGVGGEGCGSRRTLSHLTCPRHRAGLRVSHGWASVRTSNSLPVIHLREEPDALMSARPGLCGGHWVTGVPTEIDNNLLVTALTPRLSLTC